MTDAEVIAALDDRQTLALTAWAEARQVPRHDPDSHSPIEELVAVMVVVRNRLAHPSKWRAVITSLTGPNTWSYKSVCLAPNQFSCWTAGSGANHDALMVQARLLAEMCPDATGLNPNLDPELRECLYLADGAISGVLIDRTNGATMYWAPASMVPPGRVPTWAAGKLPIWIGDQQFLTV